MSDGSDIAAPQEPHFAPTSGARVPASAQSARVAASAAARHEVGALRRGHARAYLVRKRRAHPALRLCFLPSVGAALSLFTGRNAWLGGLRMVAIGGGAGILTWFIGSLLGAAIS